MKQLILNARIVNEGKTQDGDLLIENGRIQRIGKDLQHLNAAKITDAKGLFLLPGVIDDQVHFREPGLTQKATILTEARAAVAGGTTSFMEMPNTVPNTLTQELLEDKYEIAARTSLANYSFYMGVSNDNYEEVMKTNASNVCGLKIFMGSSTGNMLVDEPSVLERIFANTELLIAVHCEDEQTVRANSAKLKGQFGEDAKAEIHPLVRSEEACYKSSSFAVSLAKKHQTRLHVLHISTGRETELFEKGIRKNGKILLENGSEKKITAEACVHHMWFDARDYKSLGNLIKCNPAIKESPNKDLIFNALMDGRLDVIATDHAPHTLAEKENNYWSAPSGLPLVQHSLHMMLEFVRNGKMTIETLVDKMSHAVADCYQIKERGYVREGYWADLVLVDTNNAHEVTKESLHYKCGWSPLLGEKFFSTILTTWVSGHEAYNRGVFQTEFLGKRLEFNK